MEEATDEEEPFSPTKKCNVSMFCGRTSLLVTMTCYALMGAFLFKAIEGGDEIEAEVDFQKTREDCLKELWIITERLNVLYEKNWTRLVTEQLRRFERSIADAARVEGVWSSSSSPRWTFGGALLYSVTLLTTVGYGRLSPKTALGKITAMVYAIVGVPLMLILLSSLGGALANTMRRAYGALCCKTTSRSAVKCPTVGYHKAPASPSGKGYCKSHEDTASIQIAQNSSNHVGCKPANHHDDYRNEVPKRAILATVRSVHSRGRCRQGPVRQTLADAPIPLCPTHSHHGTPVKNSSIVGISTDIEVDDTDDTDDNEHTPCSHDTPSRTPLIFRHPDDRPATPPPLPRVPLPLALLLPAAYVCAGGAAFAAAGGWSFVDAAYFCFAALATIGVGGGEPHALACCAYLAVGLVVVAACLSLAHDEAAARCRRLGGRRPRLGGD